MCIEYGTEEVLHKGCTIKIQPDECPQSPDEWECPDVFLTGDHRQFWVQRDTPDNIEEYDVFPLEAYIHSGVALALGGSPEAGRFPDRRWDVSLVGNVYVKRSAVPDTEKAAKALVGDWNTYLSGDVWWYRIEDESGEEIDSLSGLYGYQIAIEEAQGVINYRRPQKA